MVAWRSAISLGCQYQDCWLVRGWGLGTRLEATWPAFLFVVSWGFPHWISYLLPTWAQKTSERFDWMLQSSSGWKWKKWEQMLLLIATHYWGYTSLEVKGRWGFLLPLCLLITAFQQPGTSSPSSGLKHSSEGVVWMYRASFINSSWLWGTICKKYSENTDIYQTSDI